MTAIADLRPLAQRREQRAWYWYDWANSAFVTSVQTVLFAPYLISVAEDADPIRLFGGTVAPGALPSFVVTASTIISALLLPLVGAIADRTTHKRRLLAGFAWAGAAAGALLFFAVDGNWQVGALSMVIANICLGASVTVNDAFLPLIADEEDRDRVSSRGWAFGYLGGGLLLALTLAVVLMHDTFGLTESMAVRLSMLAAAVWWAAFTVIPLLGLQDHPPVDLVSTGPSDRDGSGSGFGGLLRASFGQLWATLKDLRNYPMALTFLLAYLFFNDGIQTVIYAASTYGEKQLGFGTSVLIGTILLVQFVAFFGALLFGRLAARVGAKRVILGGLVIWMLIVTVALFLPEKALVPFLAMGVAIGLVLGGTQALARSYFSLLIPRGREGEFFSFYHAMDRGTSWFGTLTFGLVYQLTDSYRPAIFALIAFFVIGGTLLLRVDTARGMREAGNS